MADGGFDPGRRRLLFGRARAVRSPVRPPWACTADFTDLCSRCGLCMEACEETIIVAGDGSFPEIDFRRGECTFCGACADVCPQPGLFDRAKRAWRLEPEISTACLARGGIICQTCRDTCPEGAIRFVLKSRSAPQPYVDATDCTGCGACVSSCPADAVTIREATHGA